MTDIMDSKRRSALMARIRGRDTTPELAVRRNRSPDGTAISATPQRSARSSRSGVSQTSTGRVGAWMLLASARGMPVRLYPKVPGCLLDREVRGQRRTRRTPGSGLEGARLEGLRHLAVRNRGRKSSGAQAGRTDRARRDCPEAGKHPIGRICGTSSLDTGTGSTDASPPGAGQGGRGLVRRKRFCARLRRAKVTR